MPQRFYRQVTYDEQLKAYIFVDTNARVQHKVAFMSSFMSLQKDISGTTLISKI